MTRAHISVLARHKVASYDSPAVAARRRRQCHRRGGSVSDSAVDRSKTLRQVCLRRQEPHLPHLYDRAPRQRAARLAVLQLHRHQRSAAQGHRRQHPVEDSRRPVQGQQDRRLCQSISAHARGRSGRPQLGMADSARQERQSGDSAGAHQRRQRIARLLPSQMDRKRVAQDLSRQRRRTLPPDSGT